MEIWIDKHIVAKTLGRARSSVTDKGDHLLDSNVSVNVS